MVLACDGSKGASVCLLTYACGLLVAKVCEASVTGTRVATRSGEAGTVSTEGLVHGTNVCKANKSMVVAGETHCENLPPASCLLPGALTFTLLTSPSVAGAA